MSSWEIYKFFKAAEAAPVDVLEKRSSEKFRNIHRKTPVLQPLFNKVSDIQAAFFRTANLIKKRLQLRRFSLNIT